MAEQHTSLFSYNLTRPYPVRWFTPVTIIGGIIATVLVSLISVGTSGYQLIAIYSADPNVTVSSRTWFGKGLGSYIGSMQPTCNAASLPVNSLLYTNNTALPYTIEKVSRIAEDGSTTNLGSLVYYNNPLRDCKIMYITMEFSSIERDAAAIAASLEGLTTTTYVRCTMDNPQGPLTVNLTATYNKYTQPAFLGRNATSLPSLLWAESVISNWWMSLVTTFEAANDALERPTYKGRLAISPNANTLPASPDEVKSLDMLNGNAYFVPFLDKGIIDALWYTPTANISVLASMTTMNASFPASWEPADYLAKGLYYTVLTDLGQTDSHGTNIFANPDLLAYFTKNFTAIVATGEKEIAWATPYGDLPSVPFDATSAQASTLRIDPSVLATEYLCQVPQLKPTGSLIIAVLIADIVLLKTIWQLYKLVVDWSLQRNHPDMKLCEGCLARHEKIDDLSTVESKLQISSPRGQYQKIHVSERSSVFEE